MITHRVSVPIVLAGAALVTFCASEPLLAWRRRARIENRRARADCPITENDPAGRVVI